MSVSTDIMFLNANDADFVKAKNGTPKQREEWEDFNGPISDRPGAQIPLSTREEARIIKETNDEYGGWLIAVKDIPKDATHICIHRG
jgi:hypothetical protein